MPKLDTTTAAGLLTKLRKPSIVYILFMMKKLLSTTEKLHKWLQKEDVDLSNIITYKDAVLQTLNT